MFEVMLIEVVEVIGGKLLKLFKWMDLLVVIIFYGYGFLVIFLYLVVVYVVIVNGGYKVKLMIFK